MKSLTALAIRALAQVFYSVISAGAWLIYKLSGNKRPNGQ